MSFKFCFPCVDAGFLGFGWPNRIDVKALQCECLPPCDRTSFGDTHCDCLKLHSVRQLKWVDCLPALHHPRCWCIERDASVLFLITYFKYNLHIYIVDIMNVWYMCVITICYMYFYM